MENKLGKDIYGDGHLYKMPDNDNRGFHDKAASAPFDVDGFHWKEGYPDKPGYYQVALATEFNNSFYGLPVEKAYYEGDCHWSRRKCKRDSLLHRKDWWPPEEPGETGFEYYEYSVEYWCELPESRELLPCRFNW